MQGTLISFLKRAWRLLREPADEGGEARVAGVEADELDAEANAVAEQLLRDVLGPAYTELTRRGFLSITSTIAPTIAYRLRMGQPIEVFRNGRREPYRLCVVSAERVPPADELLIKLLWLRTNEAELLTVANAIR